MPLYKEKYLELNFDDFLFFDPQCRDRRIREINMRTKRCLSCPGFQGVTREDGTVVAHSCQKHPEYWLKGQDRRRAENESLED